jgi:hypothetical protein
MTTAFLVLAIWLFVDAFLVLLLIRPDRPKR